MKRLEMVACLVAMILSVTVDVVADDDAKVERVDDKDKVVAKSIRIDFDRGPDGALLELETDISELYVPLGCRFETSFQDSCVSIQPYNIGGLSGGQCAANQKPLYQGTMTIRFCKPGDAKTRATVTMAGFWIAHVTPKGATLAAYDKDDKLIDSITTTRTQTDFLAIKSKVPIAYIKIVPDVQVDPDFAIDDLFFDKPKPIGK